MDPTPSQLDRVYEDIIGPPKQVFLPIQSDPPNTILDEGNDSPNIDAFDSPKYCNDVEGKTENLRKLIPKVEKKFKEEQEQRARSCLDKMIHSQGMEKKSTDRMAQGPIDREPVSAALSKDQKIKQDRFSAKNLLQNLKPSLISYLRPFFSPEEFKAFEIIKRVTKKSGMNKKDYEDMFKYEAFRSYLLRYFTTKKIYRDLFQTRMKYKTKRICFFKLHNFERAFKTGVFKGIN